MKKVYLLPNLFTTASLFAGMLAITRVFEAERLDVPVYLKQACWLIFVSVILDSIDGKIARLTHTESAFGINYDSLSDLVAFGVAPAVLMFSVLSDEGSVKIASGVTTLYTICGALRLARFNVQRSREEKKYFTGLPIPGAAGAAIAAFLVYHRLDPFSNVPAKVLPFIIVVLACLMVSKVPYPKLANIDLERRQPFDYLVSIIVLLCVVLALHQYLDYLMLFGFTAYVTYGLARAAYGLAAGRKRAADRAEAGSPPEKPANAMFPER